MLSCHDNAKKHYRMTVCSCVGAPASDNLHRQITASACWWRGKSGTDCASSIIQTMCCAMHRQHDSFCTQECRLHQPRMHFHVEHSLLCSVRVKLYLECGQRRTIDVESRCAGFRHNALADHHVLQNTNAPPGVWHKPTCMLSDRLCLCALMLIKYCVNHWQMCNLF